MDIVGRERLTPPGRLRKEEVLAGERKAAIKFRLCRRKLAGALRSVEAGWVSTNRGSEAEGIRFPAVTRSSPACGPGSKLLLERCGTGKGYLNETRSDSIRPPGLRIMRAEV
jgi:hypothetical protein